MYGVMAWRGRQRSGDNPWTEDDFYKQGKSDWNDFKSRWDRYGHVHYDSVVEIGCGGGRITNQLAKCFDRIFAVDVSPGMMEFASNRLRRDNIEWILVEDSGLPLDDESVSAVFSCQTFQHFASEDVIWSYLQEAFRVVRPGGTIMIHMPVHFLPIANKTLSNLISKLYPAIVLFASFKAAIARWLMRFGAKPHMHMISVEHHRVFQKLRDIGYVNVDIVAFVMRSFPSMHTCVLATKPNSER